MRTTRMLVTAFLAAAGLLTSQTVALAGGGTPTPTGPAVLSTVTVNPADVLGGTPVTGTVKLTAAAPTGGFVVILTSDDTVAATVPASVTVPAGSTSANFPVTTFAVGNPQSALIIGSAGTVTTYAIVTVYTQSAFSTGGVSIIPGGIGNGTITSQPAGINCTLSTNGGSGACSANFAVGTIVRLTAKAAAGSTFLGWRPLPGCSNPTKITVARGTTINCQPGFGIK